METKPKFNIGDAVFYLNDSQIKNSIVVGIFSCFDDDTSWDARKKPKLVQFKYHFQIRTETYAYGWISESKVFATKEELIASL